MNKLEWQCLLLNFRRFLLNFVTQCETVLRRHFLIHNRPIKYPILPIPIIYLYVVKNNLYFIYNYYTRKKSSIFSSSSLYWRTLFFRIILIQKQAETKYRTMCIVLTIKISLSTGILHSTGILWNSVTLYEMLEGSGAPRN